MIALTELSLAYARRKRFEAQLMVSELSKAWGGMTTDDGRRTTARIPAGQMLRRMGIRPPGKGEG